MRELCPGRNTPRGDLPADGPRPEDNRQRCCNHPTARLGAFRKGNEHVVVRAGQSPAHHARQGDGEPRRPEAWLGPREQEDPRGGPERPGWTDPGDHAVRHEALRTMTVVIRGRWALTGEPAPWAQVCLPCCSASCQGRRGFSERRLSRASPGGRGGTVVVRRGPCGPPSLCRPARGEVSQSGVPEWRRAT